MKTRIVATFGEVGIIQEGNKSNTQTIEIVYLLNWATVI